MRKIFLLTIYLMPIFILSPQVPQNKISGRVIDEEDGQPLIGASVFIEELKQGVTTDGTGEFTFLGLKKNTTYTLHFTFLGYHPKIEKISPSNQRIKISLHPETTSLEEVTITAKNEARRIREMAMPVSVISMSQLSGTVNNITDILNKTVGVTIRNSGGVGAASRLSVRGLEGKRVGFFIDETPMNDNSDFMDINDIPIEIIERIEIYKGIVPAKFGGNAMGGAVNIVTKEYPERYADMNYEIGSFNTHKVGTILKRNIIDKGLLFGIGVFHTHADNNYTMKSPYVDNLEIKREHDQFKKTLIGGSIEATKLWFDKIEFEPVFVNSYKEVQGIEYDIRDAHTKSRAYILGNSLEKDNFFIDGLDFDMSNAMAYTKYNFVDTAKFWYDWNGKSYNSDSKYGGELGNRYASNSDNSKFTFVNKLNLEYIINEKHSFNFNSYFTLANGNPKDELRKLSLEKETVFDSKMRSWVVGLTYDLRTSNDRFLNSLTSRYYLYTMSTRTSNVFGIGDIQNINLRKNDFGFSDAMRYRFTKTFLGKISAGYDVRLPSETELLGDGNLIQPSESLLPERNASVNIGLMYDLLGKHSSNLQLEVNGFYMHLKDMIRFTKSLWGGANYQNFGEMRTIGVEFEAKADILSSLYGYGNVTFQDMRDVRKYEEESTIPNPTKGKRMPNIPYLMANAGLEFHKENLFGGSGQNTRIFTDVAFIEEYFYDFEMTETDKRRIPRSLTIDLGFEHSFMHQRLFISGKIRNLTNANVLSEFNRPLPGINYGLKLRYLFK